MTMLTGRTLTVTPLTDRHHNKLSHIKDRRIRRAREMQWATGITFEEAKQMSLDDWRLITAVLCPFDVTAPRSMEVFVTSLPPIDRLEDICYTFGIHIVPVSRKRRVGETNARAVMEAIIRDHGEPHLLLTLRSIRESVPNREALWSETFGAVSDALAQRPDWTQRPSDLFAAFDQIDLDAERRISVERRPWPVRATLRARVYRELEEKMDERSKGAGAENDKAA